MTQYQILFALWFNICFVAQSAVISKYIDCVDIAGSDPSFGMMSGTHSTAKCPSSMPSYSLTSCLAKAIGSNEDSEGSHPDDDNGEYECTAYSDGGGFGSSGIRAYARCCNLTDYGSSSFQYRSGSYSGGSNDAISTKTCPTNEKLIGCGGAVWADGNSQYFDGSYAEDAQYIGDTSQPFDISSNKCTTQNGPNGEFVVTEAQCYDTSRINDGYSLNCVSVWGHKSDIGGAHSSTVSCPAGGSFNYFMTSCSAYSPSAAIQSYYIENNVCTAVDTGGSNYVIANAICCNMTMEVADTITPTLAPTTTTDIPTIYLSVYPSKNPSKNPTDYPSIYPTYNPTYNPTSNPSKDPTINPTVYPTINPSVHPTVYPTVYPTNNPTNNPTYNPTYNPTVYPTYNPTYKPSKAPTTKQKQIFVTPKPTTATTTRRPTSDIAIKLTSSTEKINKNPVVESKHNSFGLLPFFVASLFVLFCCISICVICFSCKCMKSNKRKQMYQIGESQSIMKHPVGNKKQNVILQMSQNISSVNTNDENKDNDEGTGTDPVSIKVTTTNSGQYDNINTPNSGQYNNTPGSDNIMNDEFIVEDNNIGIETAGTIDNGGGVLMDNDGGDIVITGSDENETPGTDESDEQIVNDDDENIITIGLHNDNGIIIEGNDEVVTSGDFKEELMNNMVKDELLMDDVINDMNETPE